MVKSFFAVLGTDNRAEAAICEANAAFHALVLINGMSLTNRSDDSAGRAILRAEGAPLALVGNNGEACQLAALVRTALLVLHMFDILVHKVAHRRGYRIGGRLTETAKRSTIHGIANLLHAVEVAHLGSPLGDIVEIGEELAPANPARHALSARFVNRKSKVELGDINDAVGIIHDNHTA